MVADSALLLADLLPTGEILFEGKTFRSPSAFSVFVKRKVNPSRKADDGWTSVKYGVNLLSHYRGMLSELTGGVHLVCLAALRVSATSMSAFTPRETETGHAGPLCEADVLYGMPSVYGCLMGASTTELTL